MTSKGDLAAVDLRHFISCPDCRGMLAWAKESATCKSCGHAFRIIDGIPVVRPQKKEEVQAGERGHARGQKERQAAYFDEEADQSYEVSRPHGVPALHGWLLAEKLRRSVSALEPLLPAATALTVCGGSGMDAEYLARRGARVIASDISLGAAKRVAERARRFRLDVAPIVADAERLPFGNRTVDVVYVHDGLHHLERAAVGIAEMARVARTAVSINEPAQAKLTRLAVRIGGALDYEEAGNRVARLDSREVAFQLRAEAFEVLLVERYAMYYRHEPGPWSSWLSRSRALPAARAAFRVLNAIAARAGNKLTVQAVRPFARAKVGSSGRRSTLTRHSGGCGS
jgi:SAM-dependent methyltransferase/uncharacterized protein YbaR (Trm112 family)